MSDTNNWITVTKYKSKKKKSTKNSDSNQRFHNIKNKPKLNNYVKEKILKYCEITDNDLPIFHTWKHLYIMGNIMKNDEIFRKENKLLLLEYINKFKVYKNYKKGTENDFTKITSKLNMNTLILLEEMKNNNLYYKKQLLQLHPIFKKIYEQS
jgi:hypothetical protein